MPNPRCRELMNKNSQHEFQFTNHDGLGNRVHPISHDFYEGGRHEMLNELNRGQVRTNILAWLSSVLHDQSRNREALCSR